MERTRRERIIQAGLIGSGWNYLRFPPRCFLRPRLNFTSLVSNMVEPPLDVLWFESLLTGIAELIDQGFCLTANEGEELFRRHFVD